MIKHNFLRARYLLLLRIMAKTISENESELHHTFYLK